MHEINKIIVDRSRPRLREILLDKQVLAKSL